MGNRFAAFLERRFALAAAGTSVRTEAAAGLTTFLTMAYIIFVQPAILSGAMFGLETGMDFQAVAVATCLSAAAATLLMGLLARYPIALAPGMGQNFFFIFSAIPAAAAAGFAVPWQTALGVVFLSGILFLAVTLLGLRQALLDAVSPSLKNGIAVGIGIFIAFIGMRNAGLIVADPGTAVALAPAPASPDLAVFFFGLLLTAVLSARGRRGAVLVGILATTGFAVLLRLVLAGLPAALDPAGAIGGSRLLNDFTPVLRPFAAPASLRPVLFRLDLAGALTAAMWPLVIIFLFMDVFDTMGTLIGVGEQAGFIKENRLPRAGRAFLADALGTLFGAAVGTSTVTSYIESAAGVARGGRTGLTAVFVALFFLAALFFGPLIAMIGGYAPITAPALVVVGFLMFRNITRLEWDRPDEVIPALLIVIGIPLTYSISDGLALGFIAYPLVKLGAGRGRQVRPAMYVTAALLVVYLLVLR